MSEFANCSMRGLDLLCSALQRLRENPPEPAPIRYERVEFLYKAQIYIVDKMATNGYKMPLQAKVNADYEKWVAFERILNLKQNARTDIEKDCHGGLAEALRNVQREIERRNQTKTEKNGSGGGGVPQEETEWSDFSNTSTGSVSTRSQSLLSAKSKLKRSMSESSSRRNLRIVSSDPGAMPNSKKQKVAANPKNGAPHSVQKVGNRSAGDALERESRSRVPKKGSTRNDSCQSGLGSKQALTRSASNKDPRPASINRAEFARAQNQRVQQAKLRREQQQQQQQTETTGKDRKQSARKLKPIRNETSAKVELANSITRQNKAAEMTGSAIVNSLTLATNEPVTELSKLPSHSTLVNSTFLSGAEARPMFDATMIVAGPAGPCEVPAHPIDSAYVSPGATAAVTGPSDVTFAKRSNDATFVARPASDTTFAKHSQMLPIERPIGITGATGRPQTTIHTKPVHKDAANSTVDDTLLNPMESYCNYGLEDLCSDSDNTDDECQPKRTIPQWAHMDSARFKKRISKQKSSGDDIEKYTAHSIYMPEFVDLDDIFYNDITKRDTSSLLWDTTQTFIA